MIVMHSDMISTYTLRYLNGNMGSVQVRKNEQMNIKD